MHYLGGLELGGDQTPATIIPQGGGEVQRRDSK